MTKTLLKELLLDAFTQGAVVALANPNSSEDLSKNEWIENTMAKISDKELEDEGRFLIIKVSVDTEDEDTATIHVEKKIRKLNELELGAAKYKLLEALNK